MDATQDKIKCLFIDAGNVDDCIECGFLYGTRFCWIGKYGSERKSMKCYDCDGSGCKCFIRPDKRFKFRCYNTGSDVCQQPPEGRCNYKVNCPTCKGDKEVDPAIIIECYPDKCLLPGASQDCHNCKDVRTRILNGDELATLGRLADKIGCNNDEWIFHKIKAGGVKVKGAPVRLKPRVSN